MYLAIHARNPIDRKAVSDWLKQFGVTALAIGPVFDRKNNRQANWFFVIANNVHAGVAIELAKKGGLSYNYDTVEIVKARDARDMKNEKKKNFDKN